MPHCLQNFGVSSHGLQSTHSRTSALYITVLTKREQGKIDPNTGFSAGVFNGYYLSPIGEMTVTDFGEGLVTLSGEMLRYATLLKQESEV